MLRLVSLSLAAGLSFSSFFSTTNACTTIAVDRHATRDGLATFTTHNNDAATDDFRMAYVPPNDYWGHAQPIFPYRAEYPRYVGKERGFTYKPENNQRTVLPEFFVDFSAGSLAQFAVNRTFG